MKCAMCGHRTLESGMVDETVRVGELRYTAQVPALICPSCGESYLSAQTMRQLGARVAVELAREGVGTPEAFRYMRKRLKLPSKKLAALLGTTPEAISRWEHGVHRPDPRAIKLLGAMVLESLGEHRGLCEYLQSLLQKPTHRELNRRLPPLRATGD